MRWTFVIFFLLCLIVFPDWNQYACAQEKDTNESDTVTSAKQTFAVKEVFREIEQSLQKNTIEELENIFTPMVSVTIGQGTHGYYSSNQAFSIISGYLSERHLISVEFSQLFVNGATPYATGRLFYIQKGVRESVQVYVSLVYSDSLWCINQFNIY